MLLDGNEPASVRAEVLLLLLPDSEVVRCPAARVPGGSAPSLTGLTHLPPALMSWQRRQRGQLAAGPRLEALLPVTAFIKDFTADGTMAAQWKTERHIPGIRQVAPLKEVNLVSPKCEEFA